MGRIGYNPLEVEAVCKFRDIYARTDAYTLCLKCPEDKERVCRLAEEALFPEEPELVFELEKKEEIEEAELGLSEVRQKEALLFHLAAQMEGEENIVRLISCGGVDDGKSTVIGRILYESATEEEKQKIHGRSEYLRKDGSLDYAMLAGTSIEEAKQGITVQVSYSSFRKGEVSFLMADVPGHEEYTGNMAYAAREAALAVLMISANKGIVPQTRRHARICHFMGIKRMIFAINKMDMAGFDQEVYRGLVKEISYFMQEYGECDYQIIPVAAKAGDNMGKASANMPWYQGESLLDAITRPFAPKKEPSGFYMAVQKTCKSSQIIGKEIKKRVILGRVQGADICKGQEIFVYPTMQKAKISRLYAASQEVERVEEGQPAAIELDRELDVARGYFLAKEDIFTTAECVEADILWISDDRLRPGARYKIKIGAQEITGVMTKILYRVDVNTGDHKFAEHITKNGMARVELRFSRPVAVASERQGHTLGAFEFIDKNTDILLGYANIIKMISDEMFTENGKKVTRQEREKALGQKAGMILFPEREGMEEWMNYVERYLLHMGFHTLQAESQNGRERVFRMAEAGLLGLLSAKEADLPDFMEQETGRVCDLREEEFSQENAMYILKKVKQWAAGMLC